MLFCKPRLRSGTYAEMLFTETNPLILRSFVKDPDQRIIQRWLDPLSFRNERNEKNDLPAIDYDRIMSSPDAHCFTATIGELLAARIIIYRLESVELGKYTHYRYDDILIEILIAPAIKPVPGLSQKIWELLLIYLGSFPKTDRVYTVLSIDDPETGQVLRKAGFRFIENIVTSNAVVSLYLITGKQLTLIAQENPK